MAATRITTQDIKDAAVTTAKIADANVTFAKLSLATNPAIEDGGSGAIQVKVDGTTIDRGASGVFIKADGVGKDQLGILTTKGDLIGFSTEPIRIGVGSNGQAIVADSTQAAGLKWGAVLTGTFVFGEVPTGTVNGSNAAFTLANTPTAGTARVFKNGIRQKAGSGNDYQIATNTITFEAGNLPQTGDILLVDYNY